MDSKVSKAIIAFLALIGLCALCGLATSPISDTTGNTVTQKEDKSDSPETKTDEPVEEEIIPIIGDTTNNGEAELTVNEYLNDFTDYDAGVFQPEPGNKFVGVDVTINNVSGRELETNPFNWRLNDDQSYRYERALVSTTLSTIESGEIAPGRSVRGWLVFEIPNENIGAELSWDPFSGNSVVVELRTE